MSSPLAVSDRRAHKLAPVTKKVGPPLETLTRTYSPRSPRCHSPLKPSSIPSPLSPHRPTSGQRQRASQSKSSTAIDTGARSVRPTDGRGPPSLCLAAERHRRWRDRPSWASLKTSRRRSPRSLRRQCWRNRLFHQRMSRNNVKSTTRSTSKSLRDYLPSRLHPSLQQERFRPEDVSRPG